MTSAPVRGWQGVQAEILRRIAAQEWVPGDLIPNEADLAEQFGCARATVNRALGNLASSGILERRRKAGTRIAALPTRRAMLSIPVLRREIEARGGKYGYTLLSCTRAAPPPDVCARLAVAGGEVLLHLQAVHLLDGQPYVFEDRWINLATLPQAGEVDFAAVNANEWLVGNVPFEAGDIAFSATNASSEEARILGCEEGRGLFVIDRTTRSSRGSITAVHLVFAPGYRMLAEL